jgi:cytidyltransferase-like protein
MEYSVVGCGGTFDYLHVGHRAFLRFAFSVGKKVIIGITTKNFVTKHKMGAIAPYEVRKENVQLFLQQEGLLERAIVLPMDTVWGPAVDKALSIDALVVTQETQSGAESVNRERQQQGLAILPIIIMDLVTHNGARISSTLIREGKIDTEGDAFIQEDRIYQTLVLPELLRGSLQKPLGIEVIEQDIDFTTITAENTITIGDATTVAFHNHHVYPKIAVIDFMIQRKKTDHSLTEIGFSGKETQYSVQNPAGAITPELWDKAKEVICNMKTDSAAVLCVEGEEDLAVLPFVLLLPLGFILYYGQPHRGMVKVVVDISMKRQVKSILQHFMLATTLGS